MAAREVVWVGIDAGKQAHHAAAIDAEGRSLWSTWVLNDQASIEALIARAGQTGVDVRWAVNLTCAAATLLVVAGQLVVYVPGRTVNRMAGAFVGEGRTDAKDARIIADTARLRRDLTELSTPNELVVELSLLVAHRADPIADWVRGVNRLCERLTAIFPALERAFDYSTRSALIMVAGYQIPQAIREAGADGLAAYVTEAGAWRKGIPAMVSKAQVAADAQTVRLPAEATTAALIARLARRLLDLDREIKHTNKLLTDQFRTHHQAKIIESLPGMGPILGAEFIASTGDDLAAFGTSARLAAYAGHAPVPRDSGRRTGNLHRPKRYHRGLRRAFYMAALSSLRADGASQAFYRRKRNERLRHTQALIGPGPETRRRAVGTAARQQAVPQLNPSHRYELDAFIEIPSLRAHANSLLRHVLALRWHMVYHPSS